MLHCFIHIADAMRCYLFADAVCKAPAFGFDPHAWKCFHQYEFGQGGCLLHAHHQGHGALLLGPPLCLVPRRGNWLVHTFARLFVLKGGILHINLCFSILMFLQTPSLLVLGSLVPIVGGVVLASMTEVSFNW